MRHGLPTFLLQCPPIYKRRLIQLLLAVKCLSSAVYGINRSIFVATQLSKGSFDPSAPGISNFFSHMCGNINGHLSVAYTCERILATVFVKTYEKQKPFYGTVCLILLVRDLHYSVYLFPCNRMNFWCFCACPHRCATVT